ncbi:tyrosine-type recombinase/integrase, partial [bacterium]|nr:tyrosine-type recombinase/integrase [bacterium]
ALRREMAGARDLSPRTLEAYGRRWGEFLAALATGEWGEEPGGHLRAWRLGLERRGLAPASIRQALAAVRSLLRFAARHGGPEVSLDREVSPGRTLRLPPTLSLEQVERALAHYGGDSGASLRNRALLETLYSCGLRVSEAVSLRRRDLYLPERWLRVRGKGGRERQVPIGRPAAAWLGRWLDVAEGAWVFPGRDPARHLVRETAFRIVKRALATTKAPLAGHGPHAFRHAFATHLLARGADLRAIQELLGHADLETTTVYTHLGDQSVRAAWERFHPHAAAEE